MKTMFRCCAGTLHQLSQMLACTYSLISKVCSSWAHISGWTRQGYLSYSQYSQKMNTKEWTATNNENSEVKKKNNKINIFHIYNEISQNIFFPAMHMPIEDCIYRLSINDSGKNFKMYFILFIVSIYWVLAFDNADSLLVSVQCNNQSISRHLSVPLLKHFLSISQIVIKI